MILSVSRRTDIPSYYSEWFFNRIKEGFVYVRNPMNLHQVSRVDLSPEVVDCIVFWTKNPKPMIGRLEELMGYDYYFQFTLTGYGKDVERNLPDKKKVLIPVFQELAAKAGKERIVWRYDPVFFTRKYTPEYHLKAFGQIASLLRGYTEKCVISFVDLYAKNKKGMKMLGTFDIEKAELVEFAMKISKIARENGMSTGSCAESLDLTQCGIEHNSCIDKVLIERITGCRLKAGKDKNQRPECGCVESVEIGTYNTCKNGCIYCYANDGEKSIEKRCSIYDPESPILCGLLNEKDRITERRVSSLKERQLCLFDE